MEDVRAMTAKAQVHWVMLELVNRVLVAADKVAQPLERFDTIEPKSNEP